MEICLADLYTAENHLHCTFTTVNSDERRLRTMSAIYKSLVHHGEFSRSLETNWQMSPVTHFRISNCMSRYNPFLFLQCSEELIVEIKLILVEKKKRKTTATHCGQQMSSSRLFSWLAVGCWLCLVATCWLLKKTKRKKLPCKIKALQFPPILQCALNCYFFYSCRGPFTIFSE